MPGLWHFACAMAFAGALGALQVGELTFWLRQPLFFLPLVVSSSAFFFVPDKYAKKGPLKFLHYPLPDWDVLFLGPASHRNWLTHAPVIPLALAVCALKWPNLTHPAAFDIVAAGLCVGIGSHLFWDCAGSNRHKIVIIPHWLALREYPSRLYLLLGAGISLGVAAMFANWQMLGV